MTFHSLDSLGLAGVPVLDPLGYPGRPVPWPALLRDDGLLTLEPADAPPGRWRCGQDRRELDAVLREFGAAGTADRVPVVAVGSNASPGQVRYKLRAAGLPVLVPMVPVTVGGVGAGVSAHISRPGYVGAAPFTGAVTTAMVVTWLDDGQLAAVDATEPNYRRLRLPARRFPVTAPGGAAVPDPWLYVGRHGVLAPDGGAPRRCGDQRTLLRDLLAGSERLRALLGPGPREWVTRAAADPQVRAEGARVFAEHGWVLHQDGWPRAD